MSCLYFQLPNQKLLPVRKAGPQILDTVRMRYQPWENIAVRNSQEKSRDAQLAVIKRAIDVKATEIDTAEKVLKAKGWDSADACQKIATPQFAVGQRPFDIVDPPKQEEVARRVCVSRIKWAADALNTYFKENKKLQEAPPELKQEYFTEKVLSDVMLAPDELAGILQTVKGSATDSNFSQRQQQLKDFRVDWTHWAPSADTYTPQLGGKPVWIFSPCNPSWKKAAKKINNPVTASATLSRRTLATWLASHLNRHPPTK